MSVSEADIEAEASAPPVLHTRAYQQELLEESLRRNLVIALDTGSGKTHIAVLRMKLEAERNSNKNTGQWKNVALWRSILETHRIMVTTPQILLDALHHGYIDLGRDIGLLVFDEAHHAIDKHPYNMIMKNFYFNLPLRTGQEDLQARVRPMILGLTASPIYGGNVDNSFYKLEKNLDSIIRSSRVNRNELAQYVHRPVFKHVLYPMSNQDWETMPSENHRALQAMVDGMNIEDDPYVKSLRERLAKLPPGDERTRVDQQLSKTINKQDTFTHKGLRDFARTAGDICFELGTWAADWYVEQVIRQARIAANPYNNIMSAWQEKEKRYILDALSSVQLVPVSSDPRDILAGISPKVRALVDCLTLEEVLFRSQDEDYSGLVFVTRRDTVLALAEVLSRIPETAQLFRIGYLLGSSSSFKRHAFLDITRMMLKDSQSDTLRDFKIGDKNLIISTSVAEEGIDIQACGSVIRFDPPPNVVAWAQSRGRARRKRSSFVIMFEESGVHQKLVEQWENAEKQMMALYNDMQRDLKGAGNENNDEFDGGDGYVEFEVASTGALLTLHSATSHLNHFCAVIPNAGHGGHVPIYDLDPPDYRENWHSSPDQSLQRYGGPWGATVSLPRVLPPRTKRAAQQHAAFKAYVELYKAKLLNSHLLPLTSVVEPDKEEEVKRLLQEIEKRAGTAKVTIQMDPWAPKTDSPAWFVNELELQGLPALRMLTRNPLSTFLEQDLPCLYVPGRAPIKVRIRHQSTLDAGDAYIERARRYTYDLFTRLYGARMDPENISFSYLFLPVVEGIHEQKWIERRTWQRDRCDRSVTVRLENSARANAEILGEQFSHPSDLALIRNNAKFDKPLRFVQWHYEAITSEQEEELREIYEEVPDMRISYPLLLVKPFPRRRNFLVPLSSETEGLGHEEPFLLHPKYSTIDLVSSDDIEFAMLLPSFLRWLTNALTVASLRENLLVAVTAPVSQEALNYQRLETLGDTVLKFIVSLQLFADNPLWHEGYLSRRKDHVVANSSLAKEAIDKRLYQWILRDRFVPRKWKPHYHSEASSDDSKEDTEPTEAVSDSRDKKKNKKAEDLSTKMLADVVESLIGAAYEHGGFDLAIDCAQIFGLGISWQKLPLRMERILANTENLDDLPPELNLVESMLGYQFSRRTLLVQALTHSSYHGDIASISLERLEFLGDSALDMVVTDFLYHAPGKNYTPGHMHMRKEATVNSHFLAYICLSTSTVVDGTMPFWTKDHGLTVSTESHRIHLWQCLLHSSHRVLDDQNVAFLRYQKSGPTITHAMQNDAIYPWAALTSLQAPKFISDMVESLLGAVYVDSVGNLDVVRAVMRTLGIMSIMERIVESEVDVLHPVSRLAMWADQQDPKQKVEYVFKKEDGNVSCAIMLDDVEVVKVTEPYRSRASQEEVRFASAEKAIKLLHVCDEEEVEGWGDIPEYD
ncbi:Dicer-like protein 2 [Grifola frondosa]|uniref:Dicer-like protein 2 n=1 Tax=Grifola frondosa TaxID=5627 RepID=A0A1C7LVX1_GRIFR|nr:Dicer-like protein 2 [Grifola frondosa]